MKIIKIGIEGFRAFKEFCEISCGAFTTIVGRNDSGKSSILHALDAFFNGSPDEMDFNRDSDTDSPIVIQVGFGDLPDSIEIEKGIATDFPAENLLHTDGTLTVRKTYSRKNPRKPKTVLIVNDFTDTNYGNLCSRDEKELNSIGRDLGLDFKKSGSGITNKSKRLMIREHAVANAALTSVHEIEPDAACEKVLDYLPNFSLFKADETLSEEGASFQKEFKGLVETAVGRIEGKKDLEMGVEKELDGEVSKIHSLLLRHTDEVASIKARPTFRWKDLISFYLECKDRQGKEIAFAKRGSGLRRLLMVAYFQYLAQRAEGEDSQNGYIYGVEEPETYLHPGAQRALLESFRALAVSGQVLITSHSPVFVGSTEIGDLVLIVRDGGVARPFQKAQLDLAKVADELGVEPSDQIYGYRAVVLAEGPDDCEFLETVSKTLHSGGHIPSTFEGRKIGILPGGGDNLKHWITRKAIKGINRRYAVLLDSDRKTSAEEVASRKLRLKTEVEGDGGICMILRKRAIENYLDPTVLAKKTGCVPPNGDFDFVDVKRTFGSGVAGLVHHMSAEQLLARDSYIENGEGKHELVDICKTILGLAI